MQWSLQKNLLDIRNLDARFTGAYVAAFLAWSFTEYEAHLEYRPQAHSALTRLTSWLLNTSLFEQAWAAVCFGPVNWWWSQQLCLYTVCAWTVFLATKGRSLRVPHLWAYMLLGQLVAISVASNLFYLALVLSSSSTSSESKRKSDSQLQQPIMASPTLYIPVLISLVTIAYSPYTSVAGGTFISNLLLMHTLVIVPLLTPRLSVPLLPNIRLSSLGVFLSAVSILLHGRTTVIAFSSVGIDGTLSSSTWRLFVDKAWETLQEHHPAQSSIGWDIVWTTMSFVIWELLGGSREGQKLHFGGGHRIVTFLVTPVVSVGGFAPWAFSVEGEQAGRLKRD
ncbi:hypothetical protein D9615_009039 [Tricholomella constricta]|uniref:Uncharacterized protein n=1 Tax=Tricholomella constricta TaxID=117010 RepID=A0A8H5LYB6_9AGAR|nr:hypothetical protein D9615_009039 [Tricholomella constricta]